jgi:ParB family chromosome partitioning protein
LCRISCFRTAGGEEGGAEAKAVDPNVKEAQERMQRALGLRVRIEDKNGRGRVIIEYARLEDFDALMEQRLSLASCQW